MKKTMLFLIAVVLIAAILILTGCSSRTTPEPEETLPSVDDGTIANGWHLVTPTPEPTETPETDPGPLTQAAPQLAPDIQEARAELSAYEESDILGAYRGISLLPGMNTAVFSDKEGWPEMLNSNYAVSIKNNKNPVRVVLYDKDMTGQVTTLTEDGVYGYAIGWTDREEAPNEDFTFAGSPFCAPEDVLLQTYGATPAYRAEENGEWLDVWRVSENYVFSVSGTDTAGLDTVKLVHISAAETVLPKVPTETLENAEIAEFSF